MAPSQLGRIGPRSRSVRGVSYPRGARIVTVHELPTTGLWSAHRGSGGVSASPSTIVAPEESLSAYDIAYQMGAHILDVDALRTSDTVYVAMHDSTVDRTTQGTGAIASIAYADLPLIDMRDECGNGFTPEAVPTVAQILARYGGKVCLSIEAKNGENAVAALAALINEYNLTESVFINCSIGQVAGVGAAVVAAGIYLHVYGLEDAADVSAADAVGAWLIELPHDVGASVITAAQNATNIQRWVTDPIYLRHEQAAMTAGFHGYVSDAVGYLDRVSQDTSLATYIAQQKVAPGWRYTDVAANMPALSADGVPTSWEGVDFRSVMLGNMAWTKPTTYSVTFTVEYGAWVGDTNARTNIRVCCPSDEGTNVDANTRGYVIGLRKTGAMNLWSAPVGYGAATLLSAPNTTAIPDAGATVPLKFDVTPTTIKLTRTDTGATTGTISNTDWRGDYIWIGGATSGNTDHDMTFTAVEITT